MAKVKFDAKDFLLKQGQWLVVGAAGFFLVILLLWGATKWTSAMDPDKEANQLKNRANTLNAKLETGEPDEADRAKLQLPAWIGGDSRLKVAKADAFAPSGHLFDTTGTPNTKRENPNVLTIGEYQVDLTRAAMTGYDIIFDADGEPLIAVLTTKVESKLDDAKLKAAAKALADAAKRNRGAYSNLANQPRPPAPAPKGPGGPPPGPGGPPPGPGGPPPMGGGPPPGALGMAGGPHGLQGGYDQQAQRSDTKAIKYIPLKEIDASVRAGNLPALTVIPVRLVTVHAVVPYKKQLEELKRALRLPNPPATAKAEDIAKSDAEAKLWGPWYDGYEIQRRIKMILPNGQEQIIQDWPEKPQDPKDTTGNYKFEEEYITRIDTKKIADHFDEGYIPYFLKPEMMLAMPLPQLAKDLNVKYPEVKLKDIVENIEKLKRGSQKEMTPSELARKISGSKPKNELYKGQTADTYEGLGGSDAKKFGPTGIAPGGPGPMGGPMPGPMGGPMGGPPPGPMGIGTPKPPQGYGDAANATPNDVDNYLLRFVDSDVKPGYTYEYRVRLRMWNPNFGQDKLVANPEYAKEPYKLLYSKWLQLKTEITVPAESFLFAHDVKAYRDQINTSYLTEGKDSTPETKALNALLQVKDNQAVVQIAHWMEQVRTDNGAKREPVGAWVVAEMPVGRGEFVGRKQYVKLPLWSSETQQYVLREVTDKVVKGKYQPKGWLVDFSTKSVLVDFEGGKVKTKSTMRFDDKGNMVQGGRTYEEDVGTELLMVRPDGKLVVRSSLVDDEDLNRKSIATEWLRWVKEVEARKTTGTGTGEPNPFDPPKKN